MSSVSANLLTALRRIQSGENSPKMTATKQDVMQAVQHVRAPHKDENAQRDMLFLRVNSCESEAPTRSSRKSSFMPRKVYSLIPGRLSFTVHEDDEQTLQEIKRQPKLFFFSTDLQERYLPFCADFGPVNLGTVVQFCDYIQNKMDDKRLKNRHLVYYCSNDVESVSNTAFLLATYLMLAHGHSPDDAVEPFVTVEGIPIVPFRDPTHVESTFPLTVKDCLCGLKKAVELKWFDIRKFDLELYEDMDEPDNGDMHLICPKFIAFRGPEQEQRGASGALPPEVVAESLRKLNVHRVVRLNEPMYNRDVFEKAGMSHVDLFFEDCTTPTDDLVRRFLRECEDPGRVAVHCMAGLGRTGTMIGVWLMSEHGFSAREAIAWMRIVRPGCVIGPQQHYLVWMEARLNDGTFPFAAADAASSHRTAPFDAGSAEVSAQLSLQVRRAVSSRLGA